MPVPPHARESVLLAVATGFGVAVALRLRRSVHQPVLFELAPEGRPAHA